MLKQGRTKGAEVAASSDKCSSCLTHATGWCHLTLLHLIGTKACLLVCINTLASTTAVLQCCMKANELAKIISLNSPNDQNVLNIEEKKQ